MILLNAITKKALTQQPSTQQRNILPIVAASAVSLLGLLVLVGWYTRNTVLLQVEPAFVSMEYNTAFAFLLSGAGLLCVFLGKLRIGT